MPGNPKPPRWARDELLSLLSVSGTLAGLCITVVAFLNASDAGRRSASIVDDMLAICAAAFLLCIYLIVWALRTGSPRVAQTLTHAVDLVFLGALTVMTIAAFIMVYTIW